MSNGANKDNKCQMVQFIRQVSQAIFKENPTQNEDGLEPTAKDNIVNLSDNLPVVRDHQLVDRARECLFATLTGMDEGLLHEGVVPITCPKQSWERFHYYGGTVDDRWVVLKSKGNRYAGKCLELTNPVEFSSQAFLGCVVDHALKNGVSIDAKPTGRLSRVYLDVLLWRVYFTPEDQYGLNCSTAMAEITPVRINFISGSFSSGQQTSVDLEKQQQVERTLLAQKVMEAASRIENAEQPQREKEFSL